MLDFRILKCLSFGGSEKVGAMKFSKCAWLASVLLILSASPVLAHPGNGLGFGRGGHGAPAPLAAAGLPFLLVAGAYKAIRRRRQKDRD